MPVKIDLYPQGPGEARIGVRGPESIPEELEISIQRGSDDRFIGTQGAWQISPHWHRLRRGQDPADGFLAGRELVDAIAESFGTDSFLVQVRWNGHTESAPLRIRNHNELMASPAHQEVKPEVVPEKPEVPPAPPVAPLESEPEPEPEIEERIAAMVPSPNSGPPPPSTLRLWLGGLAAFLVALMLILWWWLRTPEPEPEPPPKPESPQPVWSSGAEPQVGSGLPQSPVSTPVPELGGGSGQVAPPDRASGSGGSLESVAPPDRISGSGGGLGSAAPPDRASGSGGDLGSVAPSDRSLGSGGGLGSVAPPDRALESSADIRWESPPPTRDPLADMPREPIPPGPWEMREEPPATPSPPDESMGSAYAEQVMADAPDAVTYFDHANRRARDGDCDAAYLLYDEAAKADPGMADQVARRFDPQDFTPSPCIASPNAIQAEEYYAHAAEGGLPHAQRRYGQLLIQDRTSGPAYKEGLEWLRQAAAAGDPDAKKLLQGSYRTFENP